MATQNQLLTNICCKLDEISSLLSNSPQQESLPMNQFCNDVGDVVAYSSSYRDEVTNVVTTLFFDTNFNVIPALPAGAAACGVIPDVEGIADCVRAIANTSPDAYVIGQRYQVVNWYQTVGGIPTLIGTAYFNPLDGTTFANAVPADFVVCSPGGTEVLKCDEGCVNVLDSGGAVVQQAIAAERLRTINLQDHTLVFGPTYQDPATTAVIVPPAGGSIVWVDCECPTLALQRCVMYNQGMFGIDGTNKFGVDADYDSIATQAGCPGGAPRNMYLEIMDLTIDGVNELSNVLVGPIAVSATGVADAVAALNAVLSAFGVTVDNTGTGSGGSVGITGPSDVSWYLAIEDRFDDGAGGVCVPSSVDGQVGWIYGGAGGGVPFSDAFYAYPLPADPQGYLATNGVDGSGCTPV